MNSFSNSVEIFVTTKNMTYLEAIMYQLELLGLDPSEVPKLINRVIKEKLKQEAIDLHLIRGLKCRKLPLD
jgi:hypothetical protein